jgi:hypothetical protein
VRRPSDSHRPALEGNICTDRRYCCCNSALNPCRADQDDDVPPLDVDDEQLVDGHSGRIYWQNFTITLQPVFGGTARTEDVDPDDFPDS